VAALIDLQNFNEREQGCWWWTGQLAKLVGLKNTPNFRQMLEEMYQEGTLLRQGAFWRPNQFGLRWSLANNAPWQKAYCDLSAEPGFLDRCLS